MFPDRALVVIAQTLEVFPLQRSARMAGKARFMALQEIPVKRGERAGVLPRGFVRIEAAIVTIVAHALDVLPCCDVRF